MGTRGFEDAALSGYAEELGLDMAAFGECVSSGRFRERVQQDFLDGQSAGVNSTATFFVNGIRLKGAQPVEEFRRVIDGELARSG